MRGRSISNRVRRSTEHRRWSDAKYSSATRLGAACAVAKRGRARCGAAPNTWWPQGDFGRGVVLRLHFGYVYTSNVIMIFTIGYEGIDLARFLALLAHHGIETLVDIREMPLSRKPGFSKTALRAAVNLSGFEYMHIAALGCPKDVRNQYKADGDWSRYKKGFLRYLNSQETAIAELAALSTTSNCALLCFESDHNYCHRSMVAAAVSAVSGSKVRHITAGLPVKTGRTDSWAFA